jgi:hypothetical protein
MEFEKDQIIIVEKKKIPFLLRLIFVNSYMFFILVLMITSGLISLKFHQILIITSPILIKFTINTLTVARYHIKRIEINQCNVIISYEDFFFKRHQIIDIKDLKIKFKRRNVLGRKYYLIFQSNKGQEVIQYDEMVWSEDDFREFINHFEERNNQLNPIFLEILPPRQT